MCLLDHGLLTSLNDTLYSSIKNQLSDGHEVTQKRTSENIFCPFNRYISLYDAIENTADQNTGKTLYIHQCSTKPSHWSVQFNSITRNLPIMCWDSRQFYLNCFLSPLSYVFVKFFTWLKFEVKNSEKMKAWTTKHCWLIKRLRGPAAKKQPMICG